MKRFPGKIEQAIVIHNYGHILNEDQEKWLRHWFPICGNEELCKAMHISQNVLARFRKKYGLKKDSKYLKKVGYETAMKGVEARKKNGFIQPEHKNPKSSRLWTRQKGPFVTVATKISKEEYDKFVDVLKANKTTKYDVLRMFIRSYIKNVK